MSPVTATVHALGYEVDDEGWERNAYRITLRYEGRRMTVPFKTGTGWDREPNAADVLESLLSDAASVENARDFEDWANEYGFDADSRKAERIFQLSKRQTARLRGFLGDDYEAAVFPTESDDYDTEHVVSRLVGNAV